MRKETKTTELAKTVSLTSTILMTIYTALVTILILGIFTIAAVFGHLSGSSLTKGWMVDGTDLGPLASGTSAIALAMIPVVDFVCQRILREGSRWRRGGELMDKKTEVNQRTTKKNRKRAVQKWIMAIVAASMVASMVAGVVAPAVSAKAEPQAPAQTETPKKKGTPVGTWYGKIFGMSVVLNLKDGGAYCIDFEGRNEETGTWIMDGDNVITDKGDNSETTYIFNGDSLITKVKGAKMKLTKDEDVYSSESDKTPNKNADESDFNGIWEADSVSIGKLSAEPSTFGITSAFLNIKNKKVDIYIDNTSPNNPIQADEMDGSFENGTLTCAIENNDKPFILDMVSLNDKTIICTLRTDDYEMQLNMKKSTEKELKKAKKMAAASEQKSKKNADSGSEPDTDNYIDSDGISTAKTKDIKPGTAGAAAHTN